MPKIIHLNNIENVTNKTNTIDENSTNEQYPSAKAVYDALANTHPIIDLGVIYKCSDFNSMLLFGNRTYAFYKSTDQDFSHGNYLGRISRESGEFGILEVTPFIYRGKSYRVDTTNGTFTEVSIP